MGESKVYWNSALSFSASFAKVKYFTEFIRHEMVWLIMSMPSFPRWRYYYYYYYYYYYPTHQFDQTSLLVMQVSQRTSLKWQGLCNHHWGREASAFPPSVNLSILSLTIFGCQCLSGCDVLNWAFGICRFWRLAWLPHHCQNDLLVSTALHFLHSFHTQRRRR